MKRLTFAACTALALSGFGNPVIRPPSTTYAASSGAAAIRVYGQSTFSTNAPHVGTTGLNFPGGAATSTDGSGDLYVNDGSNNRALFYPAGSTTATRVYGQPNFTSTQPNQGAASPTASSLSLNGAGDILADAGGGVYIADAGNNRVLYFPAGSTTASRVYGQPDFTKSLANNGGLSNHSLNAPDGLALDSSGGLFVADGFNNRILYFPAGSTTATRVYGQPDFVHNGANTGGISATSLWEPPGDMAVDSSGGLYTDDTGNNRVLYYPAGSTTATRVYGQPSFTASTANNGGLSNHSLSGLNGAVVLDSSGGLYVADSGNNRILYFPAGSTTATHVIGQPDFAHNTANNGGLSASSLAGPAGMSIDNAGGLYVADASNNRVLYYGAIAGGPFSGAEGAPVALNGSVSVTGAGSPVWNVTNAPPGATCTFASTHGATGAVVNDSITCTDNGTYKLQLVSSDGTSPTATATATLTLSNVAPGAMLSGDATVNEGSNATITFTNQSDPSSADTAAGFHYSYACDGDPAHLATSYAAATDPSSTTCFAADGPNTFNVVGRIFDKDNGFTQLSTVVQVNNVAPTANITNSSPVDEGSTALVSLTGAFDPSPTDTTAGFKYAFACVDGDGSLPTTYANATGSSTASCTYPDGPSSHTVYARIFDKDNGYSEVSTTVVVNNVAPTVTPPADATINENSTYTGTGSFSDPGALDAPWTGTVDYGDGSSPQALTLNPDHTFNLSHLYVDSGSNTLTISVTDKDGDTGQATVSVTVKNVAPTASLSNTGPIMEGTSATISFSNQFDPSPVDTTDGFHYSYDCSGKIANLATSYAAASDTSGSTACSFDDGPGTPTVVARIFDKDNGYTDYSTSVTVNNVAPTAMFNAPMTVNEGDQFTLSLTNPVDPSNADTVAGFTYSLDCGSTYGPAYSGASSRSCVAPDVSSLSVGGSITDKDGGSTPYNGTVAVTNVAPTVGAITAPVSPVAINTVMNASSTFTDPGIGLGDVHTASWNWGDGNTSAGVVTETASPGSVTGSHTYTASGVYTVTLTVKDKDGATGTSTFEYAVLYDPSAGFVTGGGWIVSPAAACTYSAVCNGATGNANFGFVSKYEKGATVPTGQTQFQFQAGKFDFHSTAYSVLVVSGPMAQYQGTGTINGQNDATGNPYSFILTAKDGAVSGGGGVDGFRIKISDSTGNVVYDNLRGADNSMTTANTQNLAGGDIVIHSSK